MATFITLIFGVVLFALAVTGLAVGVLAGRAPLAGSCGGLSGRCSLCPGKGRCRQPDRARKETRPNQ